MNRHTVGDGPSPSTSKDRLIEYSHDKQFYLIGGLIRLSDAEPELPKDDYMIRSSFGVVVCLLPDLRAVYSL